MFLPRCRRWCGEITFFYYRLLILICEKVMLLPFRLISVTVLLKVIFLPVYTPGSIFKHPYFMLRLGQNWRILPWKCQFRDISMKVFRIACKTQTHSHYSVFWWNFFFEQEKICRKYRDCHVFFSIHAASLLVILQSSMYSKGLIYLIFYSFSLIYLWL